MSDLDIRIVVRVLLREHQGAETVRRLHATTKAAVLLSLEHEAANGNVVLERIEVEEPWLHTRGDFTDEGERT